MADVGLAAYKALAAVPAVTNMLGRGKGFNFWLFRSEQAVVVEGTGQVSITISQRGGWAGAGLTGMSFPRLRLEYMADSTRLPNNDAPIFDAEGKIHAVHDQVDRILHRQDPEIVYWGNQRVLGCQRLDELDFSDVTDGQKMSRAIIYYGVILG